MATLSGKSDGMSNLYPVRYDMAVSEITKKLQREYNVGTCRMGWFPALSIALGR